MFLWEVLDGTDQDMGLELTFSGFDFGFGATLIVPTRVSSLERVEVGKSVVRADVMESFVVSRDLISATAGWSRILKMEVVYSVGKAREQLQQITECSQGGITRQQDEK